MPKQNTIRKGPNLRRLTAADRRPRHARAPGAYCLARKIRSALLAVARHREDLDERRCRCVFELLDAAAVGREVLRREVLRSGISGSAFAVLVTLHAAAPCGVCVDELLGVTQLSRGGVSAVLKRLRGSNLICWDLDGEEHPTGSISLTASGRDAADWFIARYLHAVAELARGIDEKAGLVVMAACAQLSLGGEPVFEV